MLLGCKLRSSKTNDAHKHLLIADNLGRNEKCFYSKKVLSGNVNEDNETYSSFKKTLKRPIIQVHPNNIIQFLKWVF
jgi:hypothetical protein